MAIVISGTGIDMGNNPVSNVSQIDSTVINENGDNVATTSNLVGFNNYIINGGFDIWQRGTSFIPELNSSVYTADRFQVVIMGAQKNVTREILDASYINKYGLGINGTNSATNAYVTTRLESIHTHKLHGKKINVSCKVYATNSGTMAINIDRPTEVDTYNATQTIHTENINLTSGVNNISFSVSLDGSSSTFGLQLAFIFGSLTSNDNRILADIQLEEGSVATPFENRPYGLELSLCQRYYHSGNTYWAGYAYVNARAGSKVAFPADMRTIPSVIITVNNGLSGFSSVDITYLGLNTKGVTFDKIANSTQLDGRWYIEYIASAEL